MRFTQLISLRVLSAGVLAVIGILGWRASVDGEDQATEPAVPQAIARPSGVPAKYADIYARLNRRVTFSFDKTPREEVFAFLEEKLGKKLSTEGDRAPVAHITMHATQPITIKKALREIIGWNACHIALGENEVRLITRQEAKGKCILQAHDLRFVSSYSTKLREQLIAEVQREITPDAWGAEDGPWITPGTSVFSIDICHTPEVHAQIAEALQKKYGNVVPVSNLFRRRNPEEQPTPQELKQKAETLRAKFPFESLAPRLAYEQGKASKPSVLSAEAQERLDQRDKVFDRSRASKAFAWMNLRRASLVQLHSSEVEKFVVREGFGLTRMPTPSPTYLELPPLPQLALPSGEIDPPHGEPIARVPQSAADAAAAASNLPTSNNLSELHVSSESIFLSLDRLGFVRDRQSVAGFGEHAFSRLPRLADSDHGPSEPQEHWAVRRMELVSLLKHDKPQVYVSAELPRMDKIENTPVRDLGEFETGALAKLQAGEDVVTRASLNRIEMLGALRAAKSCLECHSVERGQLLGAFSYSLVRDPLVRVEDTPVR
jgi:hypothetical protein